MDREKVIGHLNDCMEASRRDNTWVFVRKDIVEDAIVLLKEQEQDRIEIAHEMVSNSILMYQGKEIVRCNDCKWYDERISLCNNCGLPREQTFFCKDGKRRADDA